MPNYDYKCVNCDNLFEVFQKMNESLLTSCPECGGEVKRLIGSGMAPIFKGNGFYQTDYKKTSPEVKQKSDSVLEDTSTAKSNETTKSETTPIAPKQEK